jgi:hypothetical protein
MVTSSRRIAAATSTSAPWCQGMRFKGTDAILWGAVGERSFASGQRSRIIPTGARSGDSGIDVADGPWEWGAASITAGGHPPAGMDGVGSLRRYAH